MNLTEFRDRMIIAPAPKPARRLGRNEIVCSDVTAFLQSLPDESLHCIVTSPPYYGLRDYNTEGQIGLEETPDKFIARLVSVFREARRVLRKDGTCWVNMGDSYMNSGVRQTGRNDENPNDIARRFEKYGTGRVKALSDNNPRLNIQIKSRLKPKDLMMMPHRLAIALQADGWWVRSDIVWHKPNPMPESCTDRPTKSHEYVFLLTKSAKYAYDADAIREPHKTKVGAMRDRSKEQYNDSYTGGRFSSGERTMYGDTGRNKRSVWSIPTESFPDAHFATFPQALVEPCILAGCPLEVCGECGNPVVRVSTVSGGTIGKAWHDHSNDIEVGQSQRHHLPFGKGSDYKRITTGFKPTCDCNAPTKPGVVLDPFMGSGTVAIVARRLGRDYTGCDLNQIYVDMANERLNNTDPYQDKQIEPGIKQMSLF